MNNASDEPPRRGVDIPRVFSGVGRLDTPFAAGTPRPELPDSAGLEPFLSLPASQA